MSIALRDGADDASSELAIVADQYPCAQLTPRSSSAADTLRFDVPAPLWQPDLHSPGSLDTSTLATQPRSFTVNIKARIPPGPVLLRPRVTEELKWGWVQYLSFLVLTGAAAWVIRWALFSLRIVETTVLVDAPRTAAKLHVS